MGPTLQRVLTEAGYDSAVDEHADWAGDVRRVLAITRLIALTAVALLASTAVAVIAFATHAALLARRDIVDVLHLSGARDRFIASLFERRFWVLGLRAGAVGALLALGAAAAAIFAAKAHGGHAGLLPELSLDYLDLVVLVLTPVIAGLAARIAARVTVIRALKSMM
jgi:cell division transport system permease protein